MHVITRNAMKELSMWIGVLDKTRRARLKARWKFSRGKFLLSKVKRSSGFGESAAVHFVQSDLACFSDGTGKSDNDPAVEKTAETLSVVGSDAPTLKQENETRSSGGIISQ